ncbi:murein biosynthesis integral membrane protein MurJ [Mesorhizobium sp. CAU 1732]|uniref:murein biosynthesis integral membrane protein MurJ n=1 Tax=Mesorhizobium sp. CAU 1732 TaxID=3140358 RepID=UPI003260A2F7
MSLLSRAGTVGGLTLLSRLFGFGRDVVMAAILGAGPLADAFMVAFRLPNHFRAILAEGAFNSAFVPTYAAIADREGAEAAKSFRSTILAWSLIANLSLLAVALIATGWLIALLAPGLGDDQAQRDLVIDLTRITFPYLALISVVALLSGVLNAHDRFAAAAAAPILLNIAMAGTLLVAWLFPSAAHAAAWGVLLGGIAQFVLLAGICVRAGLPFQLGLPKRNPHVGQFLKRFGPAIIGAGGVQIAMFADTIIATFLPTGSLSYLYYADRLYQLPLAVIGIAIGTALLPDLSRRSANPDDRTAPATLGHAVAVCLVLGLPCAVGLALLGDLIIEVLFARGAFTAEAVSGSAGALAAYSLGLPAAIAIRALVSGFHARGDTTTPVKALGLATIVNVALKFALVGQLAHVGLATATAVGVWIYAGLLAMWLRGEGRLRIPRPDKARLIGILIGVIAGAAAVVLLRESVETRMAAFLPEWTAMSTLLVLGLLSLCLFAAPLAMAEYWTRRRTAQ